MTLLVFLCAAFVVGAVCGGAVVGILNIIGQPKR